MALRLVPAASLPDADVWDYHAEWCAAGEPLVPAASDLKGRDVAGWRADVLRMEADPPAGCPLQPLFLIEESEGRPLACLDLRHSLDTDWLRRYSGHIGYGVRPSERGKGYAKAMLRLAFPRRGSWGSPPHDQAIWKKIRPRGRLSAPAAGGLRNRSFSRTAAVCTAIRFYCEGGECRDACQIERLAGEAGKPSAGRGSLVFSGRQCGSRLLAAGTPVQRRRDPAFVGAGDGSGCGRRFHCPAVRVRIRFRKPCLLPAAFDGDPHPLEPGVSGCLPFPCLSGACADAAVDGGALVPARAGGAMVSPRGFARTRPVFIRAAAPSMGRRTGCPLFC